MLWRQIQKNNFTDLNTLLDFLEIEPNHRFNFLEKSPFVLNLPLRLAQKIAKKSLNDPILYQFLPLLLEQNTQGALDPVKDKDFQKTTSLLQKYPGRALIITTSACAMHCRYCFRKNYDYLPSNFQNELELIQNDPSLEEILLSGGDPLSLSDEKLFNLLEALDKIPHLKRIRFHTRFIVGIPERIHEGFIKKIQSLKKQLFFVIHVNHAKELDEDIFIACKKLLSCGIPVLSQTVLLKGVNDDIETLVDLFKALSNRGIIPYYLHQFDPVQGSMHFEVPIETGLNLYAQLKNHLPGYAVPSYVQEIPGHLSKTPLTAFEHQSTRC